MKHKPTNKLSHMRRPSAKKCVPKYRRVAMRPSKGIQHPDHHHPSARTKCCDRELAHAPIGSAKAQPIDGGLAATTAIHKGEPDQVVQTTQDSPTETPAPTT
jgi:hypothetical protein